MTEHAPPTVAEIAALTARLRNLSAAGAADPAEIARFLADKDALIARITAAAHTADPPPRDRGDAWTADAVEDALAEIVRARAADGGYALVGPSARTWRTDPTTGQPVEPVDEAEHKALRQLMGREEFTTTEPAWHDGETVSTVVPDDGELGLTGGDGPPIVAGPALTAEQAAHELTADGRSLDDARALVRDYLDDISERVGTSVDRWGLDEADLNDIRAAAHQPSSVDEQERRDQLARWHAADIDEARDLDDADGQEHPT